MKIDIPSTAKSVVFDIGNVLVFYDELFVANLLSMHSDIKNANEIRKIVFRSNAHYLFQVGLLNRAEFYKTICGLIKTNLMENDFFDLYVQVFQSQNTDIVTLMHEVKASGLKIGILSNINSVLYFSLIERFCWFSKLDINCTVLSCDLKYLKPNFHLFHAIEEGLSLKSDEIFYIDDYENNVTTARKRGWMAYHYIPK